MCAGALRPAELQEVQQLNARMARHAQRVEDISRSLKGRHHQAGGGEGDGEAVAQPQEGGPGSDYDQALGAAAGAASGGMLWEPANDGLGASGQPLASTPAAVAVGRFAPHPPAGRPGQPPPLSPANAHPLLGGTPEMHVRALALALAETMNRALQLEGAADADIEPPTPGDSVPLGNPPWQQARSQQQGPPYDDVEEASSAVSPGPRPGRGGIFNMESMADPAELPPPSHAATSVSAAGGREQAWDAVGSEVTGPELRRPGAGPATTPSTAGSALNRDVADGRGRRSMTGGHSPRRATASPTRSAGSALHDVHSGASPPWYPPGSSWRLMSPRVRSQSPPMATDRTEDGRSSAASTPHAPAGAASSHADGSGRSAPSAGAPLLAPTRYRTPYLTMLHQAAAAAGAGHPQGGLATRAGGAARQQAAAAAAVNTTSVVVHTSPRPAPAARQGSPAASSPPRAALGSAAVLLDAVKTAPAAGASFGGGGLSWDDTPTAAGASSALAAGARSNLQVDSPRKAIGIVSPRPSPGRAKPLFSPSGIGPAVPQAGNSA